MHKDKANKPALFDRALVRLRRGRGQRTRQEDPFLLERCALDAGARALDVNRVFKSALIVGDQYFANKLMEQASEKIETYVQIDHTNHCAQIIGSETALPFKNESFDLVISGLTLHMVNSMPSALSEMRRVLKKDGLFLGAVLGGQTLCQLRKTFYSAEDTVRGKITPRIAPFMDMSMAAGLLQNAGFAMPVVDRDVVTVRYGRLKTLYADLRALGETNSLVMRLKTPSTKTLFRTLDHTYKNIYPQADGKLPVSFEILWLTGWAPHPEQQKPLKPGSAKMRLSDALGVQEQKI